MAPPTRSIDAFPFGGRSSGRTSGSGADRHPARYDGAGSTPASGASGGRPGRSTSQGPSSRTPSTTRAVAPARTSQVVAVKELSYVGLGAHAHSTSNEVSYLLSCIPFQIT